jgi:hypothetical protein
MGRLLLPLAHYDYTAAMSQLPDFHEQVVDDENYCPFAEWPAHCHQNGHKMMESLVEGVQGNIDSGVLDIAETLDRCVLIAICVVDGQKRIVNLGGLIPVDTEKIIAEDGPLPPDFQTRSIIYMPRVAAVIQRHKMLYPEPSQDLGEALEELCHLLWMASGHQAVDHLCKISAMPRQIPMLTSLISCTLTKDDRLTVDSYIVGSVPMLYPWTKPAGAALN